MSTDADLVHDLTTLNQISETLNRAVEVREVLNAALVRLLELMDARTGWIWLTDPAAQERWWGRGYVLGAHHNLPPAMALDNPAAWDKGCECQGLCNKGLLTGAYNEVRCSRLEETTGEKRGLVVHASAPLRAGDDVLGILNVAAPDWSSFSPRALAVLTQVGSQVGVALERARLFDLLRERRVHEQVSLLELSSQLLARSDIDDLVNYLVNEVRRLLRVDASALLLPAGEPGWLAFRAASGWRADPVAERRTVPADERSGPGRVMLTQSPLLVDDLEQSDLALYMRDWLLAEAFRGHAVVPLIAADRVIGALAIDSRQPRHFAEDEIRFLALMANQAAIAIEKARLHEEEIKRQRIEEELAVARQMQLSILPEACPIVPGWDFAATYRPAHLVGGDFYDFFELPDGSLGIVIADVSDKGVPAALFMSLSRTLIRTVALSGYGPAAALRRANKLIHKDSRTDFFVTAFYGVLEPQHAHLTYANAGHLLPLWVRPGRGHQATRSRVCALEGGGVALGAVDEVILEERTVDLLAGDLLVFYTDGVTDAVNSGGELFGLERLRAALRQAQDAAGRDAGAQQVLQAVLDRIGEFAGHIPQPDDITLVVTKRNF